MNRNELPSMARDAACFTMLRDPVDRVISLYYERAYPFTNKAINDLDPEYLDYLMREFYGSGYSTYRDEVGSYRHLC